MIFPDIVEKIIVAGLTVPSRTTLDDDIAKDMIAEVIWSGGVSRSRGMSLYVRIKETKIRRSCLSSHVTSRQTLGRLKIVREKNMSI